MADVKVEGVSGALRDNVFAHLTLDEAPCDAPAWRVRRLRRKAEAETRTALEAFGYYEPTIAIAHEVRDDCWVTTIRIKRGKPVRLRQIDVTVLGDAGGEPAFQRWLQQNPLKSGAVLKHAEYETFRQGFTTLARRYGYFSARFTTARIEVHPPERAADVTLQFDSGPRFRFGDIRFEQSVLRPELLGRFLEFQPGDPYDGARIEELYDALLATGYFSVVDLRTQPGVLPDDTVQVTVTLTGAKPKVYTAGIGYSTDVGPKLRAGFTNRRLNDRGHQFDASLSLSRVLSEVGVSYRLPRDNPRVEWLSVDAGIQHEDTDTSESWIYKIGVRELHRRPRGWIETRFIDASLERFEIADERNREFMLTPGVSWSHKVPEGAAVMRPERGHRVSLKLSGTGGMLASNAEFLQLGLNGKLVLPAWAGARVLLRSEFGATAKEEFRALPASVRYFAGGDNSVRGYDFKTLGPTDENGNVIGGSHLFVASLEVDQRVRGNWSVAAFFDSGNAFDSFSSVSLKSGAGAGLRWYSPLGPVRIDVAVPLDKDAPDDWRLHVTLGPDL
ncbi:MAG: hypothetical protein AMXMBFR8_13140 [Nevskiales bacterium]